MGGEFLLFVLIVAFLFVCIAIHSLIWRGPRVSLEEHPLRFIKGKKVAVIFGATGEHGMKIVQRFLDRGYVVIGVSRRRVRWIEAIQKNGWKDSASLFWKQADVRLYRDVQKVLSEIKYVYPVIDVAVNASVIEETSTYDLFSTLKDGDDLILRLPSAYNKHYNGPIDLYKEGAPGNEHSLFTNIVGLLNLNRAEKEAKVVKIINPGHSNVGGSGNLTNTLVSDLTAQDPGRTNSMSFDEPDRIIDFVLGGSP